MTMRVESTRRLVYSEDELVNAADGVRYVVRVWWNNVSNQHEYEILRLEEQHLVKLTPGPAVEAQCIKLAKQNLKNMIKATRP